ncbi:hypothetical protein M422DRAFT_250131 [Sphaerobolus stellatus SS14]|uniref:Uncharacterized protein n=1 Tax=Sphaerobolus stellatus (strain SS14) TaxID=990650 RepID=A0A0C9UJQ7_SPHS4|nr:hypothetical protein M422DRAFT_71306 [Sphaerobolus stellatus SS14]KIJ46533.1 hypothetical protein M422DRAFT_250131 [Sphaerobolus stellatus SS14]
MTKNSSTSSGTPTLSSMNMEDSFEFHEHDDSMSYLSYDDAGTSAERLALDTESWIVWETLHGCQEAAFEDIPSRFSECLSVFHESVVEPKENDYTIATYEDIFRIAGATLCQEPWCLPSVVHQPSEYDAQRSYIAHILELSSVVPTASINVDFDPNRNFSYNPTFLDSSSPLFYNKEPQFASVVFTNASQLSCDPETLSFHEVRRYSRLATTAVLRQTHAFGVDSPIFGVLLKGREVAIHVDWYEERDGAIDCNSAFYEADTTDIKMWNLNNSFDTHALFAILSNLSSYTHNSYTPKIHYSLSHIRQPIKSWKWNPSTLPPVLTRTRIHELGYSNEPYGEKLQRWQSTLRIGKERPEKSLGGRLLVANIPKDVLSPPSTPGEV